MADLKVGAVYPGRHELGDRTILKIEGDIVTFRQKGLLTFMPMTATVDQFHAWLSGSPNLSKVELPEGLSRETWNEAYSMIVKWQDEGEDPNDLLIALYGLFSRHS